MPYTILFLSSAEIGVPLLERFAQDERFKVLGLVCQPDKPAGRKLEARKVPTKVRAEELGIPVFQPNNLNNDEDFLSRMRENPPDFLITFAYGQILGENWLKLPKYEALNIHASLLPKYRGASPIQAALINGDEVTGLSLMRMVKKMDAGPVALQHEFKIEAGSFADLVHDGLSSLAAEKIPDDLMKIASKSLEFTPQDEALVSFANKIKKEDGFVDFNVPAKEILAKFRAYMPWPGLWTNYQGKRIKLVDISFDKAAGVPGAITCEKHSVLIGTSDGSVRVKQLQLESKQCLHSDQFVTGHPEFCQATLPS